MQISTGSNTVAISLKTESGDSYLFLKDDICVAEEMIDYLRENMGSELAYVSDWNIQILGNMSECFLNDCLADAIDNEEYGFVDESDPE